MCNCTSWMRHLAQARNPYSLSWLWIPGSRKSAPRNDGRISIRDTSAICSRCCVVICPSGGLSAGVSSPVCKNISLHPSGKSSLQVRAIPPHKRGVGHRHERGVGCGGRGSVLRATGLQGGSMRPVSDQQHADERCCCVRQNRVVLTPRRWRQVRGVASAQPGLDKTYPLTTVAKEPGHRGATVFYVNL
jgi:hypothetical protein